MLMTTSSLIVALAIYFIPLQPSLDDQCQNYTYAKLHPTICGPSGGNGFGMGGSTQQQQGGGGGGGGLISGVLKGLGL